MLIPKEILSVERPKNTVVIAYGREKRLYAVRRRLGCRYVEGRHVPVNGPTIGHIVDGAYVPIAPDAIPNISYSDVAMKDWAGYCLAERVFSDMLPELEAVYSPDDSLKLYCISVLRACQPGVKDCELKEAYENSFLSELHPGVALSRNTVSKFLNDLGKACDRITVFMRNRTAKVRADHHLLVDGTLKSDESSVNSLSDFSRKARTKGTRDISVIYAFDLEELEPVCSKGFPGNMLDLTSYEAFIRENDIRNGLIVADKGFPSDAAAACFRERPGLHYLNPVKRNSRLIDTHRMLEFTGLLANREGVTFRKEKCGGMEKWLYSFRDAARAAQEERDWLRRARKNGDYSLEALREKQKSFGTVVLECDLDLPPETVYKAYEDRWEIEIVMRYYKSACEFDETRVQDDYSVIGSEFCDFLATVLTFRLIKAFDKAGLLEKMTYGKVMGVLKRAKKTRLPEEEWKLVRLNPSQEEMLRKLGLLPQMEAQPKRKRGRPRKK